MAGRILAAGCILAVRGILSRAGEAPPCRMVGVTKPLPPRWPAAVRPPGTPEWEDSAVSWLFDQVPGEYREYEVLRRHPMLLSRFTAGHVEACLESARQGWRSLRRDLSRQLPPEVVEAAMTAYEREGARLADLGRSVAAVDAALRAGHAGGR